MNKQAPSILDYCGIKDINTEPPDDWRKDILILADDKLNLIDYDNVTVIANCVAGGD